MKPKVVVGNLPTVAQGLKKIQPITKPSTPTKILPAPLVSNSTTASQPQKIFIRQVSLFTVDLVSQSPTNLLFA